MAKRKRVGKGDPSLLPSEIKTSGPSEIVNIAASDVGGPLPELSDDEIVQIVETYRYEAEYARYAGPNSRDLTWLQNLDLYWNRFDFSKKAPWQAREVMPEVPMYVDRFAANLREALMDSERFFSVKAAGDENGDIAKAIQKMMGVVLHRTGRTPQGHETDFLAAFEEIAKFGAMMMQAATVLWKERDGKGYVAIDPVDPYNIWLDPTGRGLYRIRRIEMDMHELQLLAKEVDSKGIPLYKREAIDQLTASIVAMMRAEREKRTGTGQWLQSNRRPVVLHEYLGTLIDAAGNIRGENVLVIVANNKFLIRGPEKNPFWHDRDWLVTAPMIQVPLSPYGRGYMENFVTLAKAFNELSNLMLDGVFTSALKAFAAVPSLLEDPTQLDEGVYPNVVFRLTEGTLPNDFLKEINLGQLPADAFQMWGAIKKELQEGAAFNDISLGQLAPRGRTSATEIGAAMQNSTALLRSMARNVETLFLEPLLDMVWKVQLQHLSAKDTDIRDAVGEQWFAALMKRKKEFADGRIKFTVRGISSLILKAQKFQGLLQLLEVVQGNPILMQEFMKETPPAKLLALLEDYLEVDRDRLTASPREQMMNAMMQAIQGQGQQAPGSGPGSQPASGGLQPPAPPSNIPVSAASPVGGKNAAPREPRQQIPPSAA